MNTTGGAGHNIPLDLHMEHLNRIVKDHVANLGANVAEKSILQCGKSLKGLMETCASFDKQFNVRPPSTSHSKVCVSGDEDSS